MFNKENNNNKNLKLKEKSLLKLLHNIWDKDQDNLILE